jgi:hypothetical protein
MLTEMCQHVLSDTDIKAICKSRGFSAREASSRTVFENYFLSDIGLDAAFGSLGREEIILLHLLKLEGKAVDIRFFEPLSPQKQSWHSTFTQRYTPVFKIVQSALIRKGVLLIAVAPGTATKMERWRFRFPRELEPFLPPIFFTPKQFPVAGNVNHAALRQRIVAILEDPRRAAFHDKQDYPVTLDNGELRIGNRLFSVDALLAWQQTHWQSLVWSARQAQSSRPDAKVKMFTLEDLEAKEIEQKPFPPLLNYAFSQLGADEWVASEELSTLLRLFYHRAVPPASEEVCNAGWKLGCLAKHSVQGNDYYRLAPSPTHTDEDPARFLAVGAVAALTVDLETIPYHSLEYLAKMTKLKVSDSRLIAQPHPIKMGRAPETLWQHPLTGWLREHSRVFREAIETIETRRGKQIIHTDLLLARVKDLSLKVALQKAFSDPGQLLVLPNDFIAFPQELLGDIQRLIDKSGYVVKTIRAS